MSRGEKFSAVPKTAIFGKYVLIKCMWVICMKKSLYEILFAGILAIVVPIILLSVMKTVDPQANGGITTEPTVSLSANEKKVMVYTGEDGQEMTLSDYITGVVLAEMPAQFSEEALKAQAVAARTYTLKRMKSGDKHGGGVCTDPGCCQAYCDEELFLGRGESLESFEKVKKAVNETVEQVLIYNGDYIEATYFSCSGGRTEDALAVWGSDIPYLQTVISPGEEFATHYTDTVKFTLDEFSCLLGITIPDKPEEMISNITYTTGGGVNSIKIGEEVFSGLQVRSLLELPSTSFYITALGNTVTVTTKGFGHRVGMSQYGAEAMATQGSSYQEILAHYYPGAELVNVGELTK